MLRRRCYPGGVFLWLAVRNIRPADVAAALRRVDANWLIIAVAVYLASIALRCLRWGILLRATDNVKWRHAADALLTGFAANYVLPGRIGELFRADYASRVFNIVASLRWARSWLSVSAMASC